LSGDADAAARALDAERRLWRAERASAQIAIRRGALALLSVPLAWALSLAAVIGLGIAQPMWFGVVYAVFGVGYGARRVANGVAKSRRATRALTALSPVAQLPAARVVKS
jgi:hypothetical protein